MVVFRGSCGQPNPARYDPSIWAVEHDLDPRTADLHDRSCEGPPVEAAIVLALIIFHRHAHVAAHGAASLKTPKQSFMGTYLDAVEKGALDPAQLRLVLADIPENRAAFAIMDAFPEKTPEAEAKRKSFVWRTMFALTEVAEDPRAAPFLKSEGKQAIIATP